MAGVPAYTPVGYTNGGGQPHNDTNGNHIEAQVKSITDAIVSGGANPTKVWTTTNDGNSGTAPAPKTTIEAGSKAQNEYVAVATTSGAIYMAWAWNATQGGGAVAIIVNYSGTATLVATLATHANVSIVLSGADVRFTNLYAGSCTIDCGITRIGW